MAFLRLNGVTIPVSHKRGSSTIQERSMRTRSHAGDYRTDVITENRKYEFSTTPLTEMEALAFEGLINGDGDILTFDDTTASSKNLDASGSVTIAYSSTIPTGFTGKSGTVSDGGENYDIGIGIVKPNQDLTINVWTNPRANAVESVTSLGYLFNFNAAADYANSARAYRTTDGKLNFKVSAYNASSTSDKTSHLSIADPFDGNFKMLTFVVRRNAESGEYNQYMYVNAALQAFATTVHTPTPSAWEELVIASGGVNAQEWEHHLDPADSNTGKIDDFQILPYAATSALITGWYNFGQNVGLHPKLKMDGDVTRDSIVNVIGRVTDRKFLHASGATKQILKFELVETA